MSAKEPIPLANPVMGGREVELVEEVTRSRRLSRGPMVERFERGWAERVGARNAVATSSGTGALHLCIHDLDLGPGDEVITAGGRVLAACALGNDLAAARARAYAALEKIEFRGRHYRTDIGAR